MLLPSWVNVLYADDTCIYIYISGNDINALFVVLNIELASLLEWLNANRLTLNPIRSGRGGGL